MLSMHFGHGLGPDEVKDIRQKVQAGCQAKGISNKNSFILLFVVDELACNIMEHSKAVWMDLQIEADLEGFKAVMKDDGVPFDAGSEIGEAKLKKMETTESDRHIGLSLIGRLVDGIDYSRAAGVNTVVISKRWTQQ